MPLALTACAAGLVLFGLLQQPPGDILRGLAVILRSHDTLITDYVEIGGLGAAFVNSGLVALITVAVLTLSGVPAGAMSIVTLSLMAGFSLFGKNLLNIWPILLGGFLYSRHAKEPFAKHATACLMSTCMSPIVSFLALHRDGTLTPANLLLGCTVGVLIGFVAPPLAAYTRWMQRGMNLYNMGFAAGLLSLGIVSVLAEFGWEPAAVLHWSRGNDRLLGWTTAGFCVFLLLLALWRDKTTPHRYLALLAHGSPGTDYLRELGAPLTLFNTGVNGLAGLGLLLLSGGDLNGPTLCGVFAVLGFSAYGKHLRNILPVMLGVLLGGLLGEASPADPANQLALLFCTALAPISDHYGAVGGLLAGLLHSAVVLRVGMAIAGLNLYNNGFSAGCVAILLCPLLSALTDKPLPKAES